MDNTKEQLAKDLEDAQQKLNNIEQKLTKNPDDYATDYTEAKDKLKDAQYRLDKFEEKNKLQ